MAMRMARRVCPVDLSRPPSAARMALHLGIQIEFSLHLVGLVRRGVVEHDM